MKSLTIKQLFLIHNFHHRSLDILQTIILRFDGNQWNRKNWRLAMKAKMHVMTRQQDRYIRVTHFSDVHRTLPATAKHTLDHINGLNGRDDINPRVKKFLSKCNNLPQRFFFIQSRDLYEMLLLVQMWNVWDINVVTFFIIGYLLDFLLSVIYGQNYFYNIRTHAFQFIICNLRFNSP